MKKELENVRHFGLSIIEFDSERNAVDNLEKIILSAKKNRDWISVWDAYDIIGINDDGKNLYGGQLLKEIGWNVDMLMSYNIEETEDMSTGEYAYIIHICEPEVHE